MARHLPAESNPALRRFGAELTRLRKLAELSQRKLAKATHVSPQQAGAVERAERYPSKQFAEDADQVLGRGTTLSDMWSELWEDAYPRGVGEYVEMERVASMIRAYHPLLIPGLLQTEEYARTTLRAGHPVARNEEIERFVDARMTRKRLLTQADSPVAWFIVDENVVTRPVGSASLMCDQIGVLLGMIEKRRIQFQVIPFTRNHHPGLSGSVIVLSFKGRADLAYCETVAKGEMITDPEEVKGINLLATMLQGAALAPEQSVQLLHDTWERFSGIQLA